MQGGDKAGHAEQMRIGECLGECVHYLLVSDLLYFFFKLQGAGRVVNEGESGSDIIGWANFILGLPRGVN